MLEKIVAKKNNFLTGLKGVQKRVRNIFLNICPKFRAQNYVKKICNDFLLFSDLRFVNEWSIDFIKDCIKQLVLTYGQRLSFLFLVILSFGYSIRFSKTPELFSTSRVFGTFNQNQCCFEILN